MDNYRCELCGSGPEKFKKVYTINRYNQPFEVFKCSNCGLMFRYPMPSDEEIASYYTEGYYTGKSDVSYIDERELGNRAKAVWKARIRKILSMLNVNEKPIRILDVGCSFGGLLETAKEFGLEPHGVEISEYSATYAKNKGLNVLNTTLTKANFPKDHFHIITMIELIEHLKRPFSYLRESFRILKRGGIIFVQTANIDGLQAKFWGKRYHYYIPVHLHFFSSRTLKEMLLKAGFRKVKIIYGVEFGLIPKLIKSSATFTRATDYLKWLKIISYHFLSKLHIGNKSLMSSMVAVGWK